MDIMRPQYNRNGILLTIKDLTEKRLKKKEEFEKMMKELNEIDDELIKCYDLYLTHFGK